MLMSNENETRALARETLVAVRTCLGLYFDLFTHCVDLIYHQDALFSLAYRGFTLVKSRLVLRAMRRVTRIPAWRPLELRISSNNCDFE
jgi:hypothetical protein